MMTCAGVVVVSLFLGVNLKPFPFTLRFNGKEEGVKNRIGIGPYCLLPGAIEFPSYYNGLSEIHGN